MVDFNPEQFLESQAEGEFSTSTVPCPEGTYYAQINDVDAKTIETKTGEERVIMSVIWDVLDDGVKAELGRETVRVRQDLFLDLDESGGISNKEGDNVRLGRLLSAIGMNGKKWSPKSLIGQTANVQVSHRSDKDDPAVKYPEIKRVAEA